jgi:hypothetical protein
LAAGSPWEVLTIPEMRDSLAGTREKDADPSWPIPTVMGCASLSLAVPG